MSDSLNLTQKKQIPYPIPPIIIIITTTTALITITTTITIDYNIAHTSPGF